MTRLIRTAFLAALATAISAGACAFAQAQPFSSLDPARIFAHSPSALIALEQPARHRASVGGELFYTAGENSDTLIAAAIGQPSSVASVNLVIPERITTPTALIAVTSTPALYADDTPLLPAPTEPAVARGDADLLPALAAAPVRFGAYLPYVPALQQITAGPVVPVELKSVQVTAQAVAGGMQTLHPDAFHALQVCGTTDQAAPCPYLADSRAASLNVQTNFNIRAGNDRLGLQLAGGLDRFTVGQSAVFPYVPVNPDSTPSGSVSIFDPQAPVLSYPGLTSVSRQSVGATLAVPVTPRVTVGLQFQRQRYQGDYGSLLFPGLDANKDTYLGNLTYKLPYGSSAITLSARQYRYQDLFSPDYTLTQTRADLNFTVKF